MDQMNRSAAPNPILGSRFFVPDVEAHVWSDGRVYLYGSLDLPGRMEYCSDRYHVFSSDNLTDWVDHGVAFSLQDTAWAKDLGALYAPDCAYRDGTYYLYYCVPDGRCGVAVSSSPCGPFRDIGPIAHVHGIDPAVLLDDDGCAYLYWGQMDGVRAARLKDNLTEIDPETVSQPLSVREHEFHEGSSVKKIGGKYYYLFTDTHRHGGKATCLGYAVSDHPTCGFRYGGIVVDNFPCDPETWNNHGSLCRIGDTWYVFYHRSTHASRYSRWVCAEPVVFRPDGSMEEVRMTTSGMGGPLAAAERLHAWRACERSGHARVAADSGPPSGAATQRCTGILRFPGRRGWTSGCARKASAAWKSMRTECTWAVPRRIPAARTGCFRWKCPHWKASMRSAFSFMGRLRTRQPTGSAFPCTTEKKDSIRFRMLFLNPHLANHLAL